MLCLRIFYQVKEVISCKYSIEGLWETSNETFSMESFSTEAKVFNCIPGNFLLKICSSFRTTSKKLVLENYVVAYHAANKYQIL